MSSSIIQAESYLYPAAWGAGVAYSMHGTDPLWLAAGGVAGYFAYGPITAFSIHLPLPMLVSVALPEVLAGGVIGYNLYNGSIGYALAGAAAGVAVKAAVGVITAKELGIKF